MAEIKHMDKAVLHIDDWSLLDDGNGQKRIYGRVTGHKNPLLKRKNGQYDASKHPIIDYDRAGNYCETKDTVYRLGFMHPLDIA